jgi:DNA polymerase elongation subunit (family B)
MFAKQVIESVYGPGKDPRCDAEVVYGDTDSLFLRFRPKDPVTGKRLEGKAALIAAKDLTIESGQLVTGCLKPPHDFEFDKIFRTFCLLSKKRYVGDMSEDGVEDDDFHRKSMGIVMKRRDNAPIVKYVYGGVVDRLLDPAQTDAKKAVADAGAFVRKTAEDLLRGAFPLRKLTITKSLRAEYADPMRIAHKVLADRIGTRDPGNKPSTSDRIPFVYIATTKGKPVPKLQGDRIETPTFITANGLQPDYAFYITNQISKPVSQVFGLVIEDLPGIQLRQVAKATTTKLRETLASEWLFKEILVKKAQEATGQRTLMSLVKAK